MKTMNKRKTAGFLAACMVSTILSPAMPAYARQEGPVGNGVPAEIIFDSGLGPNPTWKSSTNTVIGNVSSVGIERDGEKDILSGLTGQEVLARYGGLKTDPNAYPPYSVDSRPALPDFEVTWPGYTFDAWYTEEHGIGTKLTKMPYAFADYEKTTFFANWKASGVLADRKNFNIVHERTLPSSERVVFVATLSEATFATETINAKPKRSGIPGYQFVQNPANYSVTPETLPKYSAPGDSPIYSNIPTGSFNVTNANFTGTMPNEETTVTYRYVPNTAKKFTLKVDYVDGSGNAVATSQRYTYHAEEQISAAVAPISISGYSYSTKTISQGDTDVVASGIYSFTKAGYVWGAGDSLTGRMPNQNVTVQYIYDIDNNYSVNVGVSYKDNSDVAISDTIIDPAEFPPTIGWNPGTAVGGFYELIFEVPALTANEGFTGAYYPTATLNGSSIGAEVVAGNQVKVSVPSLPGQNDVLKVEVTYTRDAATMATVSLEHGPNGTISGDISNRQYAIGIGGLGREYTLEELVSGITAVQPATNYMEDGVRTPWFIVGAGGVLTEAPDVITLTGDLRLRACFVKDPAKWHDVTFVAGSHGSVSSISVQTVEDGTTFASITQPAYSANAGYMFQGWFDESMNHIDSSYVISGDLICKAIFSNPTPDPDYDLLVRPAATGEIAADGTGQITVTERHEDRSYAVVDDNGVIVGYISGDGSGTLTGLNPSSEYKVYELDSSISDANLLPPLNSNISDVPDSLKSRPADVIIPAVGDNATVGTDNGNSGKMQIVVDPVAPNTDYAIIDEDGNVVMYPDSDADGWITPDGEQLVFDNLDPNKNYTVVAKETGSNETPGDKEGLGSNIYTDNGGQQVTSYVVQTINGTINTVNGSAVGSDIYQNAQPGDEVRAVAALVDGDGNPFVKWEVVMGNIGMTPALGVDSLNFTMPAQHVVAIAIYDVPLGTSSNAEVEFKVVGGAGTVALNTSADQVVQLREALTTSADEDILATAGRSVLYQILFKKRAPLASESNAVKEVRTSPEEAYKAAWAIDVSLRRYVDGEPRAVEDGLDPGTFEVFALIDANHLGNDEYELWEIITAPDGTVSVNPVSMIPDPNTDTANGGLFKFEARIDAVYVLSYTEVHQVTIKNLKNSIVDTFAVYRQTALADNTEYDLWKTDNAVIIDPDGTPWLLKGLSKSETSWVPYDEAEVVKGDLTLYAHYEVDQAWLDARQNLEDKINEGNSLINTNISDEDKERLEQAIRDAENVLDGSPTQEELEKALNDLQSVIDSITGGNTPDPGPDPGPGPNPNPGPGPNPIEPGNPGGGGGGGGSSSSKKSSTAASSKYPTYAVGVDGNWELIDADNHKWVFNLNSGERIKDTWAYLSYTYDGQTLTYCYHFAADGIMDSGWFKDTDGTWYYLSIEHDGWFGRMVTGWHHDKEDGKWYYLDLASGAMRTGWNQINNNWYFFNQSTPAYTWSYNESTKRWEYIGNVEYRPFGSMYAAETTPDNYTVNADGAWVR